MATALRAANDGPPGEFVDSHRQPSTVIACILTPYPVFRTLEETRERTAALRMHVDQGMIPLLSDEPAPPGAAGENKEEESRVEALERKVARHEKRINDLVDYAKLQTCSIEHLFSVCYSLQAVSEAVSYMHSFFRLIF